VVKSVQLCWKGKKFTQSYNLYVPKGEGCKSTMCQETEDSKGNANDRRMRQQLEELNNQIERKPNIPYVQLFNRHEVDASELAVASLADTA
jgi:hypothetical protein